MYVDLINYGQEVFHLPPTSWSSVLVEVSDDSVPPKLVTRDLKCVVKAPLGALVQSSFTFMFNFILLFDYILLDVRSHN